MAESDSHDLTSGTTTPRPDPTELTDRAISKESLLRKEAQENLNRERTEQLNALETLMTTKVAHVKEVAVLETAHLREVDDIRFQAAERLAGRESELNALALAAAFAAQKEASAKEAEYTRIASIKSESATAQAIDKLGELFATQTKAQSDKVDDLKDRVGRIESVKVGAIENRTSLYAGIAAIGLILIVVMGIVTFVASHVQ